MDKIGKIRFNFLFVQKKAKNILKKIGFYILDFAMIKL